jgi:hypothetical protein
MSLSEYARHRGCSVSAVQQAAQAGRITRGPDGRVDSEQADLDWERNTNHNQARYKKGTVPHRPADIQPSQHRRDPAVDTAAGLKRAETWSQKHAQATMPNAPEGMTYQTAKAVKEVYDARLKKIELDQKTGLLISKAHVEIAYYNVFHVLRDALLNIPNRIAAQVAAETDPVLIHDLITQELYQILDDKSAPPPFSGGVGQ